MNAWLKRCVFNLDLEVTHLSLSLSASALLSLKHRYVASLILHASMAKITAQLMSLSYL